MLKKHKFLGEHFVPELIGGDVGAILETEKSRKKSPKTAKPQEISSEN